MATSPSPSALGDGRGPSGGAVQVRAGREETQPARLHGETLQEALELFGVAGLHLPHPDGRAVAQEKVT